MIFYLLSYLFAFLLGMFIMGIMWLNSWERIKEKETQVSSIYQETLAFRSNQLAQMTKLVDDLGSEEMHRQAEEILDQ